MGTIASQITSLTMVFSIVYSDADKRKHQSFASLALERGIHRRPVNSPHKWPVTRKMFPFGDVIMFSKSLLIGTLQPLPIMGINKAMFRLYQCNQPKNAVLGLPLFPGFHGVLGNRWLLFHQMEISSALLILCVGNSPVTGEFPTQRSVTQSFDAFFELQLNKRLSKQSLDWWFETPSSSLWRHCNVHCTWELSLRRIWATLGCYELKREGQWNQWPPLPTWFNLNPSMDK